MATVSPDVGIERINRLIQSAQELLGRPSVDFSDIHAWNDEARDHLARALGEDSSTIKSVIHTGGGVGLCMDMPEHARQAELHGQLENKIKFLNSAIKRLQTTRDLSGVSRKRLGKPRQPQSIPWSSDSGTYRLLKTGKLSRASWVRIPPSSPVQPLRPSQLVSSNIKKT